MDELQGPDRPSADLAGGPGLQGQEGRRHRLRRHGRDRRSGHRRRLRARHGAAALADLFHPRPQRERAGRHAARSWRSTRPGSTRSCAARSCTIRTSSPAARSSEPEAVKQELLAGVARLPGPEYEVGQALHADATGPGASASPSCRTATCSRASRPARPRWSPTRSTASPKRASC